MCAKLEWEGSRDCCFICIKFLQGERILMSLGTLTNKNKKKCFQLLSNNLQTRTVRCNEISFPWSQNQMTSTNTYLAKSDNIRGKKFSIMLFYRQIKKNRVKERLHWKKQKRPTLKTSPLKRLDLSGVTQNPHQTTLSKTKESGLLLPAALKVVFRKLN